LETTMRKTSWLRNPCIALIAAFALLIGPAKAAEVDLALGSSSNSSGYTVVPNVNGVVNLSWSSGGVVDGGYVQFSLQSLNPATLNPATNCGPGLDAGCAAVLSGYITAAGSGSISLPATTSTVMVGYTLDGGGPNQAVLALFETVTSGPAAAGNKPLLPVSYAGGAVPTTCTLGQIILVADGGTDAGALAMCGNNQWLTVKSF
jgi:hypothetical protein